MRLSPLTFLERESETGGLILSGVVVGRFRREVPTKSGEIIPVVTYRVQAGTSVHELDVWGHHLCYTIGQRVEERVTPTAFQGRGGIRLRFNRERVESGFEAP